MKKEYFIGIMLGLVFILAVCVLLNRRLSSRSGQNNEQGNPWSLATANSSDHVVVE